MNFASAIRGWGFVGYTFDTMPHLGKRDGIYYSMGYCGSGITLASYFGTRIGQQVLGLAEGRSPLDLTTFQTRPYYTGNPWFLAPAIRYYKWVDNRPGVGNLSCRTNSTNCAHLLQLARGSNCRADSFRDSLQRLVKFPLVNVHTAFRQTCLRIYSIPRPISDD